MVGLNFANVIGRGLWFVFRFACRCIFRFLFGVVFWCIPDDAIEFVSDFVEITQLRVASIDVHGIIAVGW